MIKIYFINKNKEKELVRIYNNSNFQLKNYNDRSGFYIYDSENKEIVFISESNDLFVIKE